MEYPLYKQSLPSRSYSSVALRGSACNTQLATMFFSFANIQIIQNAIRYQVWEKSGNQAVIGRQSDDELIVVMRAIFLQYAKHWPYQIPEQIDELNQLVASQVVPTILSEVTGHLIFLKDKFSGLTPLPPPVNVNISGLKTNRSVTSTF